MKPLLKIILLFFFPLAAIAQNSEKDSLLSIIGRHREDTVEANTLAYLAYEENQGSHFDSAFHYLQMARELSSRLDYDRGQAHCLLIESDLKTARGDFAAAIKDALDALAIYKKINNPVGIASAHLALQGQYYYVGEYRMALNYSLPGE